MRIAIIIPVLNEMRGIEAALRALRWARAEGAQLIVVDGGSEDDTAARARALADRVLSAPRGRARQMNAGARAAQDCDILLFLHADTRLPLAALEMVRAAIGRGAHWGRFDVRMASTQPMLRVVAFMMNLRSRLTGIATGDQAIFVQRASFEALGGYADIALMEDIDFSRRAKRLGRPACLRARVQTSARRWERHGVWRTILLMMRLRLAYFFGADPSKLAQRYARG